MFYDPKLKPKTGAEWAEITAREAFLKNGGRQGMDVHNYSPGLKVSQKLREAGDFGFSAKHFSGNGPSTAAKVLGGVAAVAGGIAATAGMAKLKSMVDNLDHDDSKFHSRPEVVQRRNSINKAMSLLFQASRAPYTPSSPASVLSLINQAKSTLLAIKVNHSHVSLAVQAIDKISEDIRDFQEVQNSNAKWKIGTGPGFWQDILENVKKAMKEVEDCEDDVLTESFREASATVRLAAQTNGVSAMNDPKFCNAQANLEYNYDSSQGTWTCLTPDGPSAPFPSLSAAKSAMEEAHTQSQKPQPMTGKEDNNAGIWKDAPAGSDKMDVDDVSKNGYGKKLSNPTYENVRDRKGYSESDLYLENLKREAWVDHNNELHKGMHPDMRAKAGLTDAAVITAVTVATGLGIKAVKALYEKLKSKFGKPPTKEELVSAAKDEDNKSEVSHGQVGKGIEYKKSESLASFSQADIYLKSLREGGPKDEIVSNGSSPVAAMESAEEDDEGTTPLKPVAPEKVGTAKSSSSKSSKKSESSAHMYDPSYGVEDLAYGNNVGYQSAGLSESYGEKKSISYTPYTPTEKGTPVIGTLAPSPFEEFNAFIRKQAAQKLSESKKSEKPKEGTKEEEEGESDLEEEEEQKKGKGDVLLVETISESISSNTPDNTIAHTTLGCAPMPSGSAYSDGFNRALEIPRDDSDPIVAMWSQQERANRKIKV